MKKLQIIGAPLDFGSENLGVDLGPDAIRHANLKKVLEKLKFKVNDIGSIKVDKPKNSGSFKLKYANEILSFNTRLSIVIEKGLRNKFYPITLGGDHSVALGSISTVSKVIKNVGLIWIDAHPDCNTDKTTLTGNIHGMPLSSLLGVGNNRLINFLYPGSKLKPQYTFIVGAKDIDEAEMEIVKKLNIKMYTIDNIEEIGVYKIINRIIEKISPNITHLHISLDLDAIDVKDAPGVGMPNYGGLSYREISYITRRIGELTITKSIDIVELNPTKDIENKTARLAVELIVNLLGKKYTPYEAYLENNKI